MKTHFSAPRAHAGQQGSVTVIMAVLLLALFALLGSVQVGYSFYLKREAQKTADLAALSGVQLLGSGSEGECADAKARAEAVARQNLDGAVLEPAPECGRLDTDAETNTCNATLAPYPPDAASPGSACAFGAADEGKPYNALRVVVRTEAAQLVPRLGIGGDDEPRMVEAHALALSAEPIAAFSVGSQLLGLRQNGVLGNLLADAGFTPDDFAILDSDGIAHAYLTPSGLLQALGLPATVDLGAGTPDELANLTVGGFLDLFASALERNTQIPPSDAAALAGFASKLESAPNLDMSQPLKLFGAGGLIELAPDVDQAAALSTGVRAVDLLAGAVAVANGQNAVNLDLTASINKLGLISDLAGLELTAKAHVVEPPGFAVSTGLEDPRIKAKNAQVRLDLTVKPTSGSLELVLPQGLRLVAELAQGEAEINEDGITCRPPPEAHEVSFNAISRLTSVCLAPPLDAAPNYSCESNGGVTPVNLLGLDLNIPSQNLFELSNTESFSLKEPPGDPSSYRLDARGEQSTVSQIANALVGGLLGSLAQTTLSDAQRSELAAGLLDEHSSVTGVRDALQNYRVTLEQLRSNNQQSGLLVSTVQATLNTVTGVLGGVVNGLTSILGNLGCLFMSPEECHIKRIKDQALNDNNYAGSLTAIAMGLLQPLLQPLGQVLDALLDTLGVGLGETDVTLHDVQCGIPRLIE